MRAQPRHGADILNNFSTLFEPNYTILTFLMIKTFFYVECIGVLALIRSFSARGSSRLAALAALLVTLVGVAAKYGPALAGLIGTEIGRTADLIVKAGLLQEGSGMVLPLAVSALFGLSALLPGRRWWVLDALHLIAALGFFGLWTYTLL